MILTWLLQVVVIIAVVGVILFDAGSIGINYFGTDGEADDIALELSNKVDSLTGGQLELEAKRLAKEAGARYVKGSLKLTADKLEVRIRREATTIIVSRVGPISGWGKTAATGSAPTS